MNQKGSIQNPKYSNQKSFAEKFMYLINEGVLDHLILINVPPTCEIFIKKADNLY